MSEQETDARSHLGEGLSASDAFEALVDVAIHSQENKLNLFSGFLFFQSILLLAWATVWQNSPTCPGRNLILHAFSIFGTVSSIVWAVVEKDYCDASDHFNMAAARLEEKYPPFFHGGPLTERVRKVAGKRWYKSGRFLIVSVTWGFVILYIALEVILHLGGAKP